MSVGSQSGEIDGPANSDPSITMCFTGILAALIWATRSSSRAAPAYSVGLPLAAADRAGSPPPITTMVPCPASATVVVNRWLGGYLARIAAAVSSLAVEAGDAG